VSAVVFAFLAAAVRRAAHLRRHEVDRRDEAGERHRRRVEAERAREREIQERLKNAPERNDA
jgi:hypothetical protein